MNPLFPPSPNYCIIEGKFQSSFEEFFNPKMSSQMLEKSMELLASKKTLLNENNSSKSLSKLWKIILQIQTNSLANRNFHYQIQQLAKTGWNGHRGILGGIPLGKGIFDGQRIEFHEKGIPFVGKFVVRKLVDLKIKYYGKYAHRGIYLNSTIKCPLKRNVRVVKRPMACTHY